jgi:hypothetical protein
VKLVPLTALLIGLGMAMGAQPAPSIKAPVELLASRVGAYIQNHNQDARGYYILARIHYLAFALNTKTLNYYQIGELSEPVSDFSPGGAPASNFKDVMSDAERAVHLPEALRHARKATELDPENGLYQLGLARIYEIGQLAQNNADWRENAIHYYLAAYQLSIEADQKLRAQPLSGFAFLVSYEAGNSYSRLVKQRGMRGSEPANVELIKKRIATLEKLPRGPVP